MRRRVLGSSKENSSSIYFAWVEHRVNSMGGAVSFPDIGPPGGEGDSGNAKPQGSARLGAYW